MMQGWGLRLQAKALRLSLLAAEMDYVDIDETLTFPENSTNGTAVCSSVAILDTPAFEKDENFTFHVSVVERNIHIEGPLYVHVTILDDDSKLSLSEIPTILITVTVWRLIES